MSVIWPYSISRSGRYILDRFERAAQILQIALPEQDPMEILRFEVCVLNFEPEVIAVTIERFLEKWAKNPKRASLKDATHLQYYIDAIMPPKGKSYIEKARRATDRDCSRYYEIYPRIVGAASREDFSDLVSREIYNMSIEGVDDSAIDSAIIEAHTRGIYSLSYIVKVIGSIAFNKTMVVQVAQQKLAQYDTPVNDMLVPTENVSGVGEIFDTAREVQEVIENNKI